MQFTKYCVMYLGTSSYLKLKYKVQASTRKNVLKYREVQVPMYLAPTLGRTYMLMILAHFQQTKTSIWWLKLKMTSLCRL